MNHEPRVSVVMATHNRADLIGRALDSILGQTYQSFEIIVVDDASTDSTQEVLHEYQRKHTNVRVLNLRQNVGPGAARNRGIQLARGEYVAIMDDDDVCVPTRFEQQVKVFEKHPTVELCFGLVQWVDADLAPRGVFPGLLSRNEFPVEPSEVFALLLLESNKVPNVTIMAKRATLLQYPYAEDVNVGEDWHMVLTMAAERVEMYGIPYVLVSVDRNPSKHSLMRNKVAAFRCQKRVLIQTCRSYSVPFTMTLRAFSNEFTREARYWSRFRGLVLVAFALLLWPRNGRAHQTLEEIMNRARHKVPLVARH